VAVATALLELPLAVAMALIVVVCVKLIGPVYCIELAVGVDPSVV
jgi:hypothetical protein